MPVWIKIQGDINRWYKPLVVHDSEEATRLKEADAQQVARSATDEYADYGWKSVRVTESNDYIVEGNPKQSKRRK